MPTASTSVGPWSGVVRRRLYVVGVLISLLLASGAAAAPGDVFTAASTPSYVKPTTSAPYTLTITNDPNSPSRGQRAKIAIPPGFSVDATSVQTSTTAGNGCNPVAWEPDGELIANSTINLKRPGNNDTGLCPGAILTVSFAATSAVDEATYTWTPQLFAESDEFALSGVPPTVVVDGTAPNVTITQRPSNPSNSRSATFTFTASEPAQCKLDGGAFTPCVSPATYGDLTDGPHTFTAASTDAAGNTGQDSYTWTVETRAPTVGVSSGPPALTSSRSATFVFSADEPSSFQCRLDGGGFLPCSSPASYQGLGDGAHSFAVRPTDAVGNVGGAVSHSWRIDATAPETRVASGPRSRTTSVSATLTFAASEQATFQCKLDAAAFAACASPKSYSRLRRSTHTFQVRALDSAGNADSTPAVFRWSIVAARRTTKTASAILSPRSGARVTSPPLLAWRPVSRALYYNVQLFRGSTKVLSAWPSRARLRLRARWTYGGRQHRLAPGRYRWYVWPRVGRGTKGRYGALIGQSTFTFARSGR